MLGQVRCLVLPQLCCQLLQLLLPVRHLGLQLTDGSLGNSTQLTCPTTCRAAAAAAQQQMSTEYEQTAPQWHLDNI
jgi:hypothetical protein